MADVVELEVETDENGELRISKEQLGDVQPHTSFKVRLERKTPQPKWGPKWANLTPEERARDFEAWARRFGDNDAPALSDWAVSRDSIYD